MYHNVRHRIKELYKVFFSGFLPDLFPTGRSGQAGASRGLRGVLVLAMMSVAGSCIDEDLSKCPSPCTDLTVRYVIEHEERFDPAFSCAIRSVHTGFWASSGILHTENVLKEDELPADLRFEITLPADDYDHIVTVNCEKDGGRHLLFPDDKEALRFEQSCVSPDTIRAMTRASFLGTLDIDLNNEAQTEYVVPLYPVVGKLELTLHHVATLSNIRCYIGHTKAGCVCWTGETLENEALITDATAQVAEQADGSKLFAFYAFPSVGYDAATRQKAAAAAADGEWKLYFLSDCATTGKTVQHAFTIKEPLYAGEVFRGAFTITETGGDHTDVEAGLEVDTDWNAGSENDVEM